MRDRIESFIAARRVAVVGVSRNPSAFGNLAAEALEARGYEIRPVNPHVDELDGRKCAKALRDLAGEVDAVLISVAPEDAIAVLEEAAEIGLERIWLQQGAESAAVVAAARRLDLKPVLGRCVLMYAPPVHTYHRAHRAVSRMFGTAYPRQDPFSLPRVKTLTARDLAVVVGLAVPAWAGCAATMAIARTIAPLELALVLHALAAPVIFAALAYVYFTRVGDASPLVTALVFLGTALALDLLFALVVPAAWPMFASVLGTWLPLALAFAATWLTGNLVTTSRRLAHA